MLNATLTARRPLTAQPRRQSSILGLWMNRAKQRRALAKLPAERLDDIGLCQLSQSLEVKKYFWQL